MTLEELITDLKAAGANENIIKLAMNCYELGYLDGWIDAREAQSKAQPDELPAEILERPATRRELPAYMRSVPGVVTVARAE
jgi:hypothetical protein